MQPASQHKKILDTKKEKEKEDWATAAFYVCVAAVNHAQETEEDIPIYLSLKEPKNEEALYTLNNKLKDSGWKVEGRLVKETLVFSYYLTYA